MEKKEFSSYWKHQLSQAPDLEFRCVANYENRVVEVMADHFDSRLFLRMALEEFPGHGIDVVFTAGFTPVAPGWKIHFQMGGLRYEINIVEVLSTSGRAEYTVLLSPTKP